MSNPGILHSGYTTSTTEDKERARPILLDVWYPAAPSAAERRFDYRPGQGMVAPDAPPLAQADGLLNRPRFSPFTSSVRKAH